MPAVRKRTEAHQPADDSIFDDVDALVTLAQRSFEKAARAAVAENDRLSIPTHGAVRGKLRVRQPLAKKTLRQR